MSEFSQWVKVISEVEKVWLIYDLDENGDLDFEEISEYLKERAFPHLSLNDEELKALWDKIDADGSGSIDKQEMAAFIHSLFLEDGTLKLVDPKKDSMLTYQRMSERDLFK